MQRLGSRALTIPFLLEFILAVAIGLALERAVARSIFAAGGNSFQFPLMPYRIFLVGFASCLCLGLSAETSQTRDAPIPWGIGRWALAVVSASALFVVCQVLTSVTIDCLQGVKLPELEEIFARVFLIMSVGFTWIPHFLAGLWLAAWLSGHRARGAVDPREWAGRIVAVSLGGLSFAGIVIREFAFR